MTQSGDKPIPRMNIDVDLPPLTEEQLANAVHARDVPELTAKLKKATAAARGRRGPQRAPTKVHTTVRLDRDIIEALKKDGERGWQSRLNDTLRKALKLKKAG